MAHYAKVLDGKVINVIVAEADFFKTFTALRVISSRFPIGVETIYKLLGDKFILWKIKFY